MKITWHDIVVVVLRHVLPLVLALLTGAEVERATGELAPGVLPAERPAWQDRGAP